MQQQAVRRMPAHARSNSGNPAQQIARRLENRIGPHKYAMWFGRAKLGLDRGRVEVVADSAFSARWISANFVSEIQEAAKGALGYEARVEILVADEPAASLNDGPSSASDSSSTGSDESRPNSKRRGSASSPAGLRKRSRAPRRLEDFVVGPSNRLAYSAACRLAEDADPQSLSPLFLHGPCGVGKTHLLLGVCDRFAAHCPAASVRYVPAEQFTNEFITAVRQDKIDEFRRRVRKLDLLAIDDVHFLSSKMRTQNEFLHTLDAIAMGGARIVLASDGHPRQIRSFNQALVSRFLSGMVVQIELPDRDMRAEIVRRIAAARGLSLSAPAVEALAQRCFGSARELEGSVTKLAALHALAGENGNGGGTSREPVGLLMVEQLFAGSGGFGGSSKAAAPVRVSQVIDAVCERLGVERSDLIGTGRHQRIVLARGLVAHLAREMTTLSYPEIAQALGRKYHSTIHTAAQRLARQLAAGERMAVNGRCGGGSGGGGHSGNGNGSGTSGEIALADLVDQLKHAISRAD